MESNANGKVLSAEKEEDTDSSLSPVHNISYAQALQGVKSNTEMAIPNNNHTDSNLNSLTLINDLSDDSANETVELEAEANVVNCSYCAGLEYNDSVECAGHSDMTSEYNETAELSSTTSEVTELGTHQSQHVSLDETVTSSATNAVLSEQDRCSSSMSSEESSSTEEEEGSDEVLDVDYPHALKWQLRNPNPELPQTVTVLECIGGGKVYLVGTAHYSVESQEDVAKTINSTIPDVVMVELCKSRVNILSLDEATLLEESKNMNFQKMRAVIRQNGFMQGVLYLLLLHMSAHLTKQLGMAPGGEFRTAFAEAQKIPGCIIHLGDRPIHVTLQRALAILSFWQQLKIGWSMLTSREPISKQEVERCKQRDLLEETLAEMTGEFPELSRVFVQERDIFLTYSLQMASIPMPSRVSPSGVNSTVVVGVVGIGHVPGIIANWGKVTEKDILPIVSVPPPSTSSRVIYKAVRYSMYGLILYCGYRILPKQLITKPIGLVQNWLHR